MNSKNGLAQGRREFLQGVAGVGMLAGFGLMKSAFAVSAPGARLKMGVLSDIHIYREGDEATYLKALEYFRDNGAEAVLVAGDIADEGQYHQLKIFADAWFKVFPNDTAPDGRHVARREFVYGESLGDDWVVPLPAANETYSYAKRAAQRVTPEFAAGAKVAVAITPKKDEKDFTHVTLTFPAAETRNKCRVCEYEVTAILCEDDVDLVQAQRRMMSPDHYRPESKLVKEVSFVFAAEDLPLKGHYRFEVRPVECFGKKGAAIVSETVKIA